MADAKSPDCLSDKKLRCNVRTEDLSRTAASSDRVLRKDWAVGQMSRPERRCSA